MPEHDHPRRFGADFKTFFVRGLAIVLPTALTIWLIAIAYAFVSEKIAQPINAGLREVVIRFTDWPEPRDEDYMLVYSESLSPAEEEALQIHLEDRRITDVIGITSAPSLAMRTARLEWMKGQPQLVREARRVAFRQHWEGYRIGAWVVLDVLGLIIAIILIYIAGLLVTSFLGRRFYRLGEDIVSRVPLIRSVYPAMKQITDFFFGNDADKISFNLVVAVQYPRKGLWSVGLVTGDTMSMIEDEAGEICLTVFVPSSPTPFTGYVITVPKTDTIDLPINIEDALKFAVSGGVVIPQGQVIDRTGQTPVLPGMEPAVEPSNTEPDPKHKETPALTDA
jgi:uncharacterized membrane protein